MSGHSKWAQIKHKKAKMDAARGKLFTKLIREITIAARQGGGNPEHNPRLRNAIEAAKEANMPQENIERAIKKGTGELPGVSYEESIYEGYAPGGVAVMVEIQTDNKNRTLSEIKHIFAKHGGHLGSTGCVSWQFHKKGVIQLDKGEWGEDKVMELAIELGVEDIKEEESAFTLYTRVEDFQRIKNNMKEKGINYTFADITMVPETLVRLEGEKAEQVLSLVNELDEHPDVQNVYANFDIPEEILEAVLGNK